MTIQAPRRGDSQARWPIPDRLSGGIGAILATLGVVLAALIGLTASTAAAQDDSPAVRPASCEVSFLGGIATIDFVPAADDNASRYLLYRNEDDRTNLWSASISATSAPTFTWEQTQGSNYSYGVKTRSTTNDFSDLRNCGDDDGLPPLPGVAPVSCTAQPAVDGVRSITFVAADFDNASRYLLYRSENGGGWSWSGVIFAGSEPVLTWTETPGVDYTYAVKTRGLDEGFTGLTECGIAAAPVQPVPACTSTRSGPNVTLAWEPNGASSYFLSTYEYDVYNEPFIELDGDVAHYTYEVGKDYPHYLSTEDGPPRFVEGEVAVTDYCEPAEPGGILPVGPVACSAIASDTDVLVGWDAVAGDTADRYVIYARESDSLDPVWQGSVAAGEASFTKSGLADPSNMAWLVKTRTTLADGTRIFSDGAPCGGSSFDYVAGDMLAEAVSIAGTATIAGTTVVATLEDGEEALTFSNQEPGCFELDYFGGFSGGRLEPSIWYEWTPGGDGAFALALDSPNWRGGIAVYEPTVAPATVADLAGTSVDCDRAASGGTALVDVSDPSTTYYVQVFGEYVNAYRQANSFGDGTYTLTIAVAGP